MPDFGYDLPGLPQMPDDPEVRKILIALAQRQAATQAGDDLPPLPSLERKHYDNPIRNAFSAIGDVVNQGQIGRERKYDDAVQAQNLTIANRRNALAGRQQDTAEAEERRKAALYEEQQQYKQKLLAMVDDPNLPASTKREVIAQLANMKTDPLHLAALQTEGDARQAGYREGLGDLYSGDVKARGDLGQAGAGGTAVSNPDIAGPGELPELSTLTPTTPTTGMRPTFGTPPVRSLTNLQPVGAESQQAPEPPAMPTSPMMRGRDPSFLPDGVPPMQTMRSMTPVAGGPTAMPTSGPAPPSAFSMTDSKPVGSIGLNSLKIGADDLAGRPGVTFKTNEDIRQSKNSYHAPATEPVYRVQTTDENGNPVTRFITRSEAAGHPDLAAAPTADMRNRSAASRRAMPTLTALQELSKKINVNKGLMATAQGLEARALAKANYDDDTAEYLAIVDSFTPIVARALGHTGVLTQQDVDSAKAIIPKPEDSDSLALRKIERILTLIDQTSAAGVQPGHEGGGGGDANAVPNRPAGVPANSAWVMDAAHPNGFWKPRPAGVPDSFVWTVDPTTGKGMWKAPQ